jgi:hypothetical protein
LCCFLGIWTVAQCHLKIQPGSLSGTERDDATGLSDKQLGMLRFFSKITADPSSWGEWDVSGGQLDFDSIRYGLAFVGYATVRRSYAFVRPRCRQAIAFAALSSPLSGQPPLSCLLLARLFSCQPPPPSFRYSPRTYAGLQATLSFVHTPAYPDLSSTIMKAVFTRMLDPVAWNYWNRHGACGEPWKEICKLSRRSMCETNDEFYAWEGDSWCPDPVHRANIMYSAHLAQIALLSSAWSGQPVTDEWSFGTNVTYNLTSLLLSLAAQAERSAHMGGGLTCEPGSVNTLQPKLAFVAFAPQ